MLLFSIHQFAKTYKNRKLLCNIQSLLFFEVSFAFIIIFSEEEMKRFQEALQEDGAYNSVAFSYQYNAPEIPAQYPQIPTGYEAIQSG